MVVCKVMLCSDFIWVKLFLYCVVRLLGKIDGKMGVIFVLFILVLFCVEGY